MLSMFRMLIHPKHVEHYIKQVTSSWSLFTQVKEVSAFHIQYQKARYIWAVLQSSYIPYVLKQQQLIYNK